MAAKPKLRISQPSTGESPNHGNKFSKIPNLSLGSVKSVTTKLVLATPKKKILVKPRLVDAVPCPDLVITAPLEKAYSKLKLVAKQLKLDQVS